MAAKTHYEVLEVLETASDDAIKGAFKFLAQKWHPDRNPGNFEEAQRRMTELNEAFAELSDPARRRAYDERLKTVRRRNQAAPAPPPKASSPPPPPPRPSGQTSERRSSSSATRVAAGTWSRRALSIIIVAVVFGIGRTVLKSESSPVTVRNNAATSDVRATPSSTARDGPARTSPLPSDPPEVLEYRERLASYEQQYPALDPGSPSFDPAAARRVSELLNQYWRSGYSPADALKLAMAASGFQPPAVQANPTASAGPRDFDAKAAPSVLRQARPTRRQGQDAVPAASPSAATRVETARSPTAATVDVDRARKEGEAAWGSEFDSKIASNESGESGLSIPTELREGKWGYRADLYRVARNRYIGGRTSQDCPGAKACFANTIRAMNVWVSEFDPTVRDFYGKYPELDPSSPKYDPVAQEQLFESFRSLLRKSDASTAMGEAIALYGSQHH